MNKFLLEETRALYEVFNWPLKSFQHRAHFAKFGEIDLKEVTPKMAEALIRKGFPYIKQREKSFDDKPKKSRKKLP